jgi:hypothetical protein
MQHPDPDHGRPAPALQRPHVCGQVLEGHALALEQQDATLLAELASRLESIGRSYSTMAQQVGALYMRADESGLDSLTRTLDRPMRNASTDRQTFDALLEATLQARQERAAD